MKKSRFLLLLSAIIVMFNACDKHPSSENEVPTKKEAMLKSAVEHFVDRTVIPTYRAMSDNAIALYEACEAMHKAFQEGTLTKEKVSVAGDYWRESRVYWERSEAFLYGAAADYNIDPHIDSWPLDRRAMDHLLSDIASGKEWSIDNNVGYGLLGFHAVEYLLFELSEDGKSSLPHSLTYSNEELIYLTTVAADLAAQCILLEASWAGVENISELKQSWLDEYELEPSINYGESMKRAGRAGSLYISYQDAAEDIIQGCIDIADEVGNTKIGRPANATTVGDKNYIESPYSLNSITDFVDNIVSIQNSYCGSNKGDASISDYIKSVNSELDKQMREHIQEAMQIISAIPEPFALSASGPEADRAVEYVGRELVTLLERVMTELSKQ